MHCEGVIIQTTLANEGWEIVFIDEFNISSHKNKFRGWPLKEYKPTIKAKLDSFSMYFILAVSMNNIYGVLTSVKACNHQVFIYFLDNLMESRDKVFKMNNKKTIYIMDNCSIHKAKKVAEYAKSRQISLLTITTYSPSLNGAEKIIQAIKAKTNKYRSRGRYELSAIYYSYRAFSLSLIAKVIKEVEREGLQKYFQSQRKEILSEFKTKLK